MHNSYCICIRCIMWLPVSYMLSSITKSIMVNGSVKFPYAVSKMIVQSSMASVLTPLKDISKQDL